MGRGVGSRGKSQARGVTTYVAWTLLFTSPLLVWSLLRARVRRWLLRTALSILLPILKYAARLVGLASSRDMDPHARTIEDPDLPVWLAGVSSLEGAERRAGKELWEWWLDALSFRPDSAGRLHIRQTLKHPDVQRKINELFEALDVESRGHLDADAVVRFSEGIQGTVRVLLDQREPRCVITIPPATAAEHDFLVMNFPILFPPEHPLDLRAFQSLAKLVLVRRIVKALVTHHGLYRVQRGMRAPIVVDLTVREMSWCDETGKNKPGVPLFKIHTVAPSTAAAVEGFRLGSIEESPSNSSSPRAADQHWKKRGKTLFGGGGTPSAG